jgi:hypothetical protein
MCGGVLRPFAELDVPGIWRQVKPYRLLYTCCMRMRAASSYNKLVTTEGPRTHTMMVHGSACQLQFAVLRLQPSKQTPTGAPHPHMQERGTRTCWGQHTGTLRARHEHTRLHAGDIFRNAGTHTTPARNTQVHTRHQHPHVHRDHTTPSAAAATHGEQVQPCRPTSHTHTAAVAAAGVWQLTQLLKHAP